MKKEVLHALIDQCSLRSSFFLGIYRVKKDFYKGKYQF